MKRIMIITLAFLLSVTLCSCQEQNKLVGTWTTPSWDYSLDKEYDEIWKFSQNGELLITSSINSEKFTGKWEDDGKTLLIITPDGQVEHYTYIVTDTRLILRDDMYWFDGRETVFQRN